MNIVALAGSLRKGSYNRQLAEAAGRVMSRRHPQTGYRILAWDDVPFMNQDVEHPAPRAVARVREEVREADGLWLFSPEYNHAVPGPLKNLLDWLSRPVSAEEGQVLARKPVALSGASIGMSGAAHAQEQLIGVLSLLDARLMNAPKLCIAHVASQSKEGVLELGSSQAYLEAQADAFVRFVEQNLRP